MNDKIVFLGNTLKSVQTQEAGDMGTTKENLALMPSHTNPAIRRWQKIDDELEMGKREPVKQEPLKIRAVAYRVNGKVYEGKPYQNHGMLFKELPESVRTCIEKFLNGESTTDKVDDGFVSTTGKFLTRKEVQEQTKVRGESYNLEYHGIKDKAALNRLSDIEIERLKRNNFIQEIKKSLDNPNNLRDAIKQARKETDPNPTEEQKKAGNYAKGKIQIHGMTISIENPKGSYRSGVDKDGNEWRVKMHADYGYISRAQKGSDGDSVDVFIGDNPESEIVFIVNQQDPKTKEFDEHKVMIGYNNEAAARSGYEKNYNDRGFQRIQSIVSMTIEEFKKWLAEDNMNKPARKSLRNIVFHYFIKSMQQLALFDVDKPTGTTKTTQSGEILELKPSETNPKVRRWHHVDKYVYKYLTDTEAHDQAKQEASKKVQAEGRYSEKRHKELTHDILRKKAIDEITEGHRNEEEEREYLETMKDDDVFYNARGAEIDKKLFDEAVKEKYHDRNMAEKNQSLYSDHKNFTDMEGDEYVESMKFDDDKPTGMMKQTTSGGTLVLKQSKSNPKVRRWQEQDEKEKEEREKFLPQDMPYELRDKIKEWKFLTRSPYGDSFYDSKDKSWNYTEPNSYRIADHWNVGQGGEIGATDGDVENDTHWSLGRFEETERFYLAHIDNPELEKYLEENGYEVENKYDNKGKLVDKLLIVKDKKEIESSEIIKEWEKTHDKIVFEIGNKGKWKILQSLPKDNTLTNRFFDNIKKKRKEYKNESAIATNSDIPDARGDITLGISRTEGGGKRPKLRLAGKEFLPTPRNHVSVDEYSAKGGIELDDQKRLGINLALTRFLDAKGAGFLLADGTGFGKTIQQLVIADKYYQAEHKPVLIITQNKQIIKGNFKVDAKKLGIDINNFELVTYDDVRKKKTNLREYGLICFDEAHNLKNQDAQKTIAAAALKSDHILYATATPFDRPSGASYFLSQLFEDSEDHIRNLLGFKRHIERDEDGEEQITWVLNEGQTWDRVAQNIANMRDEAIKKGAMVRREYPFWGDIKITRKNLAQQDIQEERDIISYWNDKISTASGGSFVKKNYAGQKVLELSRWLESKKIEDVWSEIQKAQKSKQSIVIVAEGINETIIKGLAGEVRDEDGNLTAGVKVKGLIGEIERRLNEAGIDFARIYGDNEKADEVEKFQNGTVRIALATPKSGGAGINLDDIKGDNPRKLYIVTPNFAGDTFEQILGRVSRYTTQSPAEVEFNIYDDAYSDIKRAKIVSKKLEALRNIQDGTDIDVAHFDLADEIINGKTESAGELLIKKEKEEHLKKLETEMPELWWKSITSKSGRNLEVAPATKEFWVWWKANKEKKDRNVWVQKDSYTGDWVVWRDKDKEGGITKSLFTIKQFLKSQLGLFQMAQAQARPAKRGDIKREVQEGETKIVDGKIYTLRGVKDPKKKRWHASDEQTLFMLPEQTKPTIKPEHKEEKQPQARHKEVAAEVNAELTRQHKADIKNARAYETELDLFSASSTEHETEKPPTDQFDALTQDTDEVVRGRKTRARINKEVIELLNSKTDAEMTEQDLELLSKYTGKGGTEEGDLNEYYTHPKIAKFVWAMLEKLGFKGGQVLEPSCATGVFIQTKPNSTLVTGVEISPISARIATLLNPNDIIINQPYEDFATDKERTQKYDAVIGNLPFGNRGAERGIHKPQFSRNEEYFIDTIFDDAKPMGLIAMIVPSGIMDNDKNMELRKSMLERGEFLGAIRLPNTAFKHTGTPVVTDIIYFRKYPDSISQQILTARAKNDFDFIEAAGVMDKDFINSTYYDTEEGKNYIWGTEVEGGGRWNSMTLKGKVTEELMQDALQHGFTSRINYEKFNTNPADYAEELHVGDTIVGANGRTYILNENHRWERMNTREEEREKILNQDFTEFGAGTREDFHAYLVDVSKRMTLSPDQIERAIEYLDVVTDDMLPNARAIQESIVNAKKAMQASASPDEAEKNYKAAIIGKEIERLQELVKSGTLPDFINFQQLTLLIQEHLDRYGNPNKDKALVRLAMTNKAVARFIGAVTDEGKVSDFMLNPDRYLPKQDVNIQGYDAKSLPEILKFLDNQGVTPSVRTIARYWELSTGKTDEEIEQILLEDENVGYDEGKFYPLKSIMQGTVYDKIDRWQAEIDRGVNEAKRKKLQLQMDRLRELVHYRTIEDMPIKLTSRYIPMQYLNEYLQSRGMKGMLYDDKLNTYEIDYSTEGIKPDKDNLYGDIILYINNLGLKHGVQNKFREAAIEEFEEQFKNWLAIHDKRDEIENAYNRAFNNYINMEYDDTPIKIDKIADGFELNRYHYAAIRKLYEKGKGILAYDVGLGKTFCSLALMLLKKQNGEIKKPLFVVPKSVIANWVSEVNTLTKGKDVKMIIVGMTQQFNADGSPKLDADGKTMWKEDGFEEVQRKIQQVSQNEYDIVLMTRDKLDMLSLSKDVTKKYLDDVVERHLSRSNAEEVDAKGKKKKSNYDTKSIIAKIKGDIMGRFAGGHEKVINTFFDDMGIDSIVVDEAHNYRKLFGLTGRPIRWAMSQPDTQRSIRMYMFSKWIREKNNGKNVYMLSATPTVNNPLETFNMMQYIAPESFDKRKIYNIKDFFDIFGKTEKLPITRTDGSIREMDALTGFERLKELRQLAFEYMHMVRGKDVGLKMPKAEMENRYTERTPLQQRVYNELRERAQSILSGEQKDIPKEERDHLFSILSDMQKATISLKLLKATGSKFAPVITDEEIQAEGASPKLRQYIQDAMDIYRGGHKHLCFAENKELQEELRDELIKAGANPKDIFIVNADTVPKSQDRLKVSKAYNEGKYKIIIGNSTMQEGMNFQNGTHAIAHLTIPWTPADIQQRNGRGVRQGNKLDKVRILTYMTRGTYDNFLADTMVRKMNWQTDLYLSDVDKAKNLDTGQSFDQAELAVMLSDDPEAERIKQAAKLQTAIQQHLEASKARTLSAFNQYQNLVIQHSKMTDEERKGDKGQQVLSRINTVKSHLYNDEHFEHKHLLEDNTPCYIDADQHTIIPTGHLFTSASGDYEAQGLYRFLKVDPVNRKVVVQKVTAGTENPNNLGKIEEMGYGQFRENNKHGVKAVNVPTDYIHNHVLPKVKDISHVLLLDADTITKNKKEIIQSISGNYHATFPVLNKETGEINIRNYFYTGREEIYLPIDKERWMRDVIERVESDMKQYREDVKRYGSRRVRIPESFDFANKVFGKGWERTFKQYLQKQDERQDND